MNNKARKNEINVREKWIMRACVDEHTQKSTRCVFGGGNKEKKEKRKIEKGLCLD